MPGSGTSLTPPELAQLRQRKRTGGHRHRTCGSCAPEDTTRSVAETIQNGSPPPCGAVASSATPSGPPRCRCFRTSSGPRVDGPIRKTRSLRIAIPRTAVPATVRAPGGPGTAKRPNGPKGSRLDRGPAPPPDLPTRGRPGRGLGGVARYPSDTVPGTSWPEASNPRGGSRTKAAAYRLFRMPSSW